MSLTIVRLYHDLLGTYGDQGNAEILIYRASARGIKTELIEGIVIRDENHNFSTKYMNNIYDSIK